MRALPFWAGEELDHRWYLSRSGARSLSQAGEELDHGGYLSHRPSRSKISKGRRSATHSQRSGASVEVDHEGDREARDLAHDGPTQDREAEAVVSIEALRFALTLVGEMRSERENAQGDSPDCVSSRRGRQGSQTRKSRPSWRGPMSSGSGGASSFPLGQWLPLRLRLLRLRGGRSLR
jgi:hypothetical protein